MHQRNKHNGSYDFEKLVNVSPTLKEFVSENKYGNLSIDFFNPIAVKELNKALLFLHYNIKYWDIPKGYLCPPIPGRVDYIHYLADVLMLVNSGKTPKGIKIKCLDIGTGANCVYPLVGYQEYGWQFVGADIDGLAVESSKKVVSENNISDKIEIRKQVNKAQFFTNIIQSKEYFDITLCNPPFHESKEAAQIGSSRKIKNLKKSKDAKVVLNFAGQSNELWCDGGELVFIKNMILDSQNFSKSVMWFTTLVSKKQNLNQLYKALEDVNVFEVKTIDMSQGNKQSRFIAWTFLSKKQQKLWVQTRW